MIEMEFYDGKNEEGEIHDSMMRTKAKQGRMTHVMDICQFRKQRMPSMSAKTKRGIEAANENPRMTTSGH